MINNATKTSLSDIADISLGEQLNRSTLTNAGRYAAYNGGMSASGYTNKFNTPAGTIIISQGGESAGFVNYIAKPFWAGAHCYTIHSHPGVNNLYLYYYLKSMQSELQRARSGSSIPGLNKSKLESFPINILSQDAQSKIVSILGSIDEAIHKNKLLLVRLAKTIELIYNYWFVQFDFPDENGRPYKSSGGKMVYNEQLKQEIPENWTVKRLLDIASWTSGAQPPKSQHINQPRQGYIRFIQNRDYSSDKDSRYIPISKSNKLCNRYDIMMDKYGDAGRTRFGLSGAYNVALAKIEPVTEDLREYLRSFLSQPSVYNYLHESCMASTRASLNAGILNQLTVPIPDNRLLKSFNNISKNAINLSLVAKDESKLLTSLRDWLLPMLMNGQVTINSTKEQ